MRDDHGANENSAERQALFRVSLIAAGLIAAGVSLWAWEDKREVVFSHPNLIELGQKE
jgi:hypothetical protein